MDAENPEQASGGYEGQIEALTRENVSSKMKPPDVSLTWSKRGRWSVGWFQVQLRQETERLLAKVSYLERRVERLAGSSAEFSSRLVRSEEDKLKVQLKDC